MTFDPKHGMEPEKYAHPVVAEKSYDVSEPGPIRFSLDWRIKSVIIDFQDAAGGAAAAGSVNVYPNENTGGLPWAVVKASKMLCRPIAVSANGTSLVIVPAANSVGLLTVTALREVVAPGRF